MASDLSSGCTEVIEILDEKEEGEISLEDVSSSEEGQLNDRCNLRRRTAGQCPSCLSTKHCAGWCAASTRTNTLKSSMRKDAVQEKENCHHTKDSGYSGSKHCASTLQENNNDLIPISSDSDMEIVGLADNVKQILTRPQAKATKVRKRRKKKRSQTAAATIEDAAVNTATNLMPECSVVQKHDSQVLKDNHLPRLHRRESNSPHKRPGSPYSRSRITKSPMRRHKSPIGRGRSPFIKSRSPLGHPRSPVLRKSPIRRTRSPVRRLSPHSPVKSPVRRQLRSSVSPTNTYIDMYGNVNKLLKKVRHLKTIGSQSANRNVGKLNEHRPSLKDKLNNMIKGDNGSSDFAMKTNKESKFVEDVDDEEDLALLRKMALETKPKRNSKVQEDTGLKKSTQCETNNSDEDVEDLELRMIALRSAMLKKHQDRKQRAVMIGKSKKPTPSTRTNTDSPFSQSFLDSIPIPDEKEKNFETPPCTPTRGLNENNNPEDMELDSEVELDKEKEAEPYSPTDQISQKIPIDTELLGIRHSDVSFITPANQITVVSDNLDLQVLGSAEIKTLTGASYLLLDKMSENSVDSSKHVLPSSQSPTSSPCFPNNMTEILENNHCPQLDDNLPTTPYSPSEPIGTPEIYMSPQGDSHSNSDPNHIPDTPYSPTDTPMCDFEVNTAPLLFNVSPFKESDTKKSKRNRSALIHINLTSTTSQDISKISNSNTTENSALSPIPKKMMEIEKENMSRTSSMNADIGSAFDSSVNSSDDTMIEVDELPETDLDGSPLVHMPAELQDIESHIPDIISQEILKLSQEPLYLQGVPDVTKDANKIPTLVNKSLVPASILRSNKNLQQPLPPKKIETHFEPAFKSAQMRPVEISTESTNTSRLFKPIKLAPVIKKPQLNIVKPSAFNCSSNDNSTLEDHENFENDQSAQSQNEQEIRSSSETCMSTDQVPQLGNRLRIVETIKKLPEPIPELQTTVAQYQEQSDMLRNSNKESAKKGNDSANEERKKQSKKSKPARIKSKHTSKSLMNSKNIETKYTVANVANAIAPEESISTEIPLRCKQNSKSNLSEIIHSPENSMQKNRNSRNKSKKQVVEKRRRERDRRSKIESVSGSENKRKSDKKYCRLSNDLRKSSADKINDKVMELNHHSQTVRRKPEETEHMTQPAPMCVEPKETFIPQTRSINIDKGNNYSTAKHSKIELGIHENTSNDRISDTVTIKTDKEKMNNVNETIANISNTSTTCNMKDEPSAYIAKIHSQGSGDSILENTVCQKVEANKRRRSSLDEDEEALRAILLASLAKRNKPPDPANTITKTTALANLSHSSVNTSTESVKGLPNTPAAKASVSLVYSSSSDATTPLTSHTSMSSNPPVKNSIPRPLSQVATSDSVTVKSILPENLTPDPSTLSTALSRKRSVSASGKGPPKKIAKKAPISASTKVVNNAKKYQNTLFQKKLNLQKAAMISNAHKTLNHTNLHGNNLVDGSRSRSMITKPLSETQRFVINLASDSESENETELQNKNHQEQVNPNRSEQKPVLSIPMSEFEKSVDLFLKDVRKKQETAAATKPSLTKTNVTQKPVSPATSTHRKSPVLSATPLAVRHLPVSQQEEYRRLKQQILEREKMKLHRVLGNNSSPLSPSSKSSGTPPGPLSPASPISSPITSRQNYNGPLNSQPPMTTASKDYQLRKISVQNNLKTTVSSGKSRMNTVVSKVDGSIPSISNLSIQIPNETTNVKIASKKSIDLYIPVSTSQTRLVTPIKSTKDTVNTKDSDDSTVLAKGQSNLKNVQVQLQQGKTGRTVSLGGGTNLNTKLTVSSNQELQVVSPHESTPTNISTNIEKNQTDITALSDYASISPPMDSRKATETIDLREKCDSSVDSMASTLVISREGEYSKNSTSVDSSASTVILPRNENSDNSRLGSGNSESNNKNSGVSKSSGSEPRKLRNNKEIWEKIRGDVKKELDSISVLPPSEQKSYLANVEHNLVKKRYAILDDLSEISGNLRELEMERDVQTRVALEVKKLQEQLKLAEERLEAQRDRVNKMVPNITVAYEKLNSGRRECVKMTRICLGLGCLVIGANYKIPAAGAQLLNNRLKQVAGCTRQLSKKKALSLDKDNVPSKPHPEILTNCVDHCLDSPVIQSPQSIAQGSSKEKDDEFVITSNVALTEDHSNSNTELTAGVEADQISASEEETLKLQDNTAVVFLPGSIREDLPQSTSTPNSSGESCDVNKHLQDCETTISTFVLDGPKAGLIGQNESLEQRKFLQPYKSVLTHLKVPRTTDPSGILCPYELMGTCRDEGCQFMHQSARNG